MKTSKNDWKHASTKDIDIVPSTKYTALMGERLEKDLDNIIERLLNILDEYEKVLIRFFAMILFVPRN